MKDFIVVGLGFAGITFSHQLLKKDQRFVVFDRCEKNATRVAAAVYNPVILKRFTPVWCAEEQIRQLKQTFSEIEQLLGEKLDYPMPVYRRLTSVEEQNNWFSACDNPKLSPFLIPSILPNNNPYLNADFGLAQVQHTGRIDTQKLTDTFQHFLYKKGCLVKEYFDYSELIIYPDKVVYKGIEARNIVFCEGFSLKQNPYFNYLPLTGCKGEVLTIKSDDLHLDGVLKGNGFIIPMGNNLYKVGSTYDRENLSDNITEKAQKELLDKLYVLTSASYELKDQQAAVRPTVSDRRPLVGRHPEYRNLFVVNGLGTRGSMIGAYASQVLSDFIFNKKDIPQPMNIQRFESIYYKNNKKAQGGGLC